MFTLLIFVVFSTATLAGTTESIVDSSDFEQNAYHGGISGDSPFEINPEINRLKVELPSLHNNYHDLSGYINSRNAIDFNMLRNMRRTVDPSDDIPPRMDCTLIDVEPSNDAPDSYDWRDHMPHSPVRDVGKCTLATAMFTAAANVEAMYMIKHKDGDIDLSVQQLFDCQPYVADKLNVCPQSHRIWFTYNTILAAGGLMSSSDYKFNGTTQECKVDSTKIAVKVTECNEYSIDDEDELKEVLYKVGPLAIGMSNPKNQTEIVTDCEPRPQDLMSGLLVGYGSENGTDFWTIKLPYGNNFANDGYARVQRGRGCLLVGTAVFTAVLD